MWEKLALEVGPFAYETAEAEEAAWKATRRAEGADDFVADVKQRWDEMPGAERRFTGLEEPEEPKDDYMDEEDELDEGSEVDGYEVTCG